MTDALEPSPAAGAGIRKALQEIVDAIEAKAVKIDGPRVFSDDAPAIFEDDEHVLQMSWPWADEWLHHAKTALATPTPVQPAGPHSSVREAQANIDGKIVARMIINFHREFASIYPDDVHHGFSAVGPLQSLIGLAIANGLLALPSPPISTGGR